MTDSAVEPPLSALVELCRSAEQDLTLVAPFAKAAVLAHLLAETPERTRVRLVTRWRLDECLAGVSDIECWTVLRQRSSAEMLLVDRLHAKAYANERQGLVGSANLTWAALRGGSQGNIEVQTPLPADSPEIRGVLDRALPEALLVTDQLFALYQQALGQAKPPESSAPKMDVSWRPSYRRPDEILAVARGAVRATADEVNVARQELAGLGLTEDAAESQVTLRLLELSLTRDLVVFLHHPGGRRFGEVSAWYRRTYEASELEAQTLYRWIRTFLEPVIRYERPHHSEILTLR
jgi:hypothetical protein